MDTESVPELAVDVDTFQAPDKVEECQHLVE